MHDWITEATLPAALVQDDGTILSSSPAWRALLGPLTKVVERGEGGDVVAGGTTVRLQSTRVDIDRRIVVATDLSKARAETAELEDRVAFLEWQALSLSTFSKAMQHAGVVLFSMDPTGITTMSDGKGLDLLGLSPGEALGRNELDATRGTDVHEHLVRALGGETFRALAEPAPGVFFDTWYMPLRNENDEPDGVLGLSVDATERVRSARELAQKVTLIEQQSATIRALSAPIIKVWDEVVCMPIVGGVDASRVTEMMSNLLDAIARDAVRFAVIDLTGVQVMDTSTVDHILRIFKAARSLGARSVLSGVQPAVAHTIVALGVDVRAIRMMRTLHDALGWCLAERQHERNESRRALPRLPRPLKTSNEENQR